MNWLILIVAGLFEVVWATVLSPAPFRLACWIDATRKSNNAPDGARVVCFFILIVLHRPFW